MDLQLAKKVFVVTGGGTGGLGLATAECLIEEGANVLVTGRTEDKFGEAQRNLKERAEQIAFRWG